mmetsp:Transcript_99096/g.258350  ORF Transcript_99096/g.258350 Transcript_99096/m.258350 type:complete len:216 (+) Transcript_99096:1417-2064(+)
MLSRGSTCATAGTYPCRTSSKSWASTSEGIGSCRSSRRPASRSKARSPSGSSRPTCEGGGSRARGGRRGCGRAAPCSRGAAAVHGSAGLLGPCAVAQRPPHSCGLRVESSLAGSRPVHAACVARGLAASSAACAPRWRRPWPRLKAPSRAHCCRLSVDVNPLFAPLPAGESTPPVRTRRWRGTRSYAPGVVQRGGRYSRGPEEGTLFVGEGLRVP